MKTRTITTTEKEVKGEFHFIVTKVYDSEGECLAISNAVVPGVEAPGVVAL